MALHAILVHRRVLIRERSLILGMALEAEVVPAGRVQTVSRATAMRIMAIHAGHFPFPDRVVIRKVGLRLLLLVALQALIVQGLRGLEQPQLTAISRTFGVYGVASGALQVLSLVCAREPVPHVIGLGMTAQAGAVGLVRRTIFEADDLVFRFFGVTASLQVQASGTVTLLTLDIADGVLAPPVALADVCVTLGTLIRAYFGGTLDLNVLAEILRRSGGLGLGRSEERGCEE